MQLNLGCGSRILPGYINIDMNNPRADLLHDLRKPLPYPDESADEILAEHIIEHFTQTDWERIQRDWARVLKTEGRIIIHCPDIVRCCDHLVKEKRRWRWLLPIYGNPAQTPHLNGFDYEKLKASLALVNIEVTDHFYMNDRVINPGGFNLGVIGIKKGNL